ncbi:putative methyltransferase PMT21 [Stylosanthes scabra]|uniref:Methyltransferase PMT21 n=1 Tax=Stylosanthes scabra TaxID=79078 RepID=A0ABU6TH09_9FABA|nr:putative methyltransferase PMT21 [Stylosanthes scabra]
MKSMNLPECGVDYQDYTPCTDPRMEKVYGSYRLTLLECHCPPTFERKECLVPPPESIYEGMFHIIGLTSRSPISIG